MPPLFWLFTQEGRMAGIGKLGVLEEFFAQRIWFLDVGEDRRIVGCSIKVEPSGYLAVVKAVSTSGPQVTFVGARTLDKIRTALSSTEARGKLKWRDDKYELDRK